MLPARTFSVSIKREWRDLYEQIWHPEFFAKWASGLAQSELRQDDKGWHTDGADGPVRIRFTPHNEYGVMDHAVETDTGTEIHVPLRIIQNGDGAEVMLTLFRQPDMDDERFSADTKWVVRDLKRLKELSERRKR